MNKEDIRKEIIDILKNDMGINFKSDLSKESLFSQNVGLLPRDLLVLFFRLQNRFDIKFSEDDVIKNRFDYIDNIVDSIYKKISY